jgi:hypothetical protein
MAKEKKQQQTQTEIIQQNIKEGRLVIMKKENENLFIRIRFNNTQKDDSEKWRLLVNGNEFQTAEIFINCKTRTLTERFEDIGIKHHIVCDAKEVVFKDNIATIN